MSLCIWLAQTAPAKLYPSDKFKTRNAMSKIQKKIEGLLKRVRKLNDKIKKLKSSGAKKKKKKSTKKLQKKSAKKSAKKSTKKSAKRSVKKPAKKKVTSKKRASKSSARSKSASAQKSPAPAVSGINPVVS